MILRVAPHFLRAFARGRNWRGKKAAIDDSVQTKIHHYRGQSQSWVLHLQDGAMPPLLMKRLLTKTADPSP